MSSASRLQEELRQKKPFRTQGHEATVEFLRAADQFRRRMSRFFESHGTTVQQYNVLRILRGAHPDPLPVLEIAERMIEETPGITRLLDRLEAKKTVRRERSKDDRRQYLVSITERGLETLAELDAKVDVLEKENFESLTAIELRMLIDLLERLRANW